MIKNDLLELVQSLSKSERRMFKLSLKTYSNKDENILESLFDIYCKNKQLVNVNKKASTKISSSRIKKMHSELYKKLQNFIGIAEIKEERKYKLYNNIFIARAFLKRKLYNQAYNITFKTIQEAEEFEIYPVLVESYGIMQFLEKQIGAIKKPNPFKDSFLNDYLDVIEKNYTFYKSFNTYAHLLNEFSKNGPTRDKFKILEYEKLVNKININYSNGFNINKVNLLCLSMLGHLNQNTKLLIDSKENLYLNYINNPKFIKHNPTEFFLTCYNYAGNIIEGNQMD